MAVRLETFDILTQRGRLEPDAARAIGDAIEVEIRANQPVTMPVFELRMSQIEAKFSQVESRFTQVDGRFTQLEAKMDARLAQLEARLFLKMAGVMATGIGLLIAVLRVFRYAF